VAFHNCPSFITIATTIISGWVEPKARPTRVRETVPPSEKIPDPLCLRMAVFVLPIRTYTICSKRLMSGSSGRVAERSKPNSTRSRCDSSPR
jgi:hypothetical protein